MRFPKAPVFIFSVLTALTLGACGGSGTSEQTGSATLSQATNPMPRLVTISPSLKVLYMPETSRVAPPPGTPPLVSSWASLSPYIKGVPCFNCAGNPPISGSLGIAMPQSLLPHTGTWEITYAFYNVSEGSNACTFTFGMKQGKTQIISDTFNSSLNGNGEYVYFYSGAMPSQAKPGPATVSADASCNGFTAKAAIQNDFLS